MIESEKSADDDVRYFKPLPKSVRELRLMLRGCTHEELTQIIKRTTATIQSGDLDSPQFDGSLNDWVAELQREVDRRKVQELQ